LVEVGIRLTPQAEKFIEEGKISLEDKITKYLEDFNGVEASILHMLTYTLNFKNFTEEEKKKFMENLSVKDFRDNILKIPFESEAGKVYKYSDATADLQGMILEKVSSKKLKELFDLYVKDFFELKNTSLEPKELVKENIPPTQILENKEIIQGEVNDAKSRFAYRNGVFSGCAGLFGDVFDISKLCKCILNFGVYEDRVFLNEGTINLMQKNNLVLDLPTPLCTGDNSTTSLRRELGIERKIIGKSGFTGCQVMLDMESSLGMVFLSNRTYPLGSKHYPEWNEFRRQLVAYIFQ
jgi:CubicO group peptidase (beta-lactamase class C family)